MPLIRSASLNLFIEVLVRVGLLSLFCYMETMQPFERVLHRASLETDCKYPRHDSYVPGRMLWTIVVSVPFVISLLAWGLYSDCNDGLEFLLAWSLSLGINGVLTDTMKLIAGRPRPDFFYRCFPDGVETEDLTCTGDPMEVMEGRKSFPSGHSSLAFCSLGMAAAWLAGRLEVFSQKRGSGVRLCVCIAPLVLALCVAISRTCDYHHHWQDVIFGSILGFAVAITCYRQYYNPLSSDLSGIPYVVTHAQIAKYANNKSESPLKDSKEESTPLLNGKKEDKWI